MESIPLNEFIYKLKIRLNQNTPPCNFVNIVPTGISSIQIRFSDIDQKEYQLESQTPEEIACDFERNLYEELYKNYKKGLIPNPPLDTKQ